MKKKGVGGSWYWIQNFFRMNCSRWLYEIGEQYAIMITVGADRQC